MMSPTRSSELDRMLLCARSVWTTTLGLRGSVTSTPVKFLGGPSCASHRMRRPPAASWIAIPSPMPPHPASGSWAISVMLSDSSRVILFSVPVVMRPRLRARRGDRSLDSVGDDNQPRLPAPVRPGLEPRRGVQQVMDTVHRDGPVELVRSHDPLDPQHVGAAERGQRIEPADEPGPAERPLHDEAMGGDAAADGDRHWSPSFLNRPGTGLARRRQRPGVDRARGRTGTGRVDAGHRLPASADSGAGRPAMSSLVMTIRSAAAIWRRASSWRSICRTAR